MTDGTPESPRGMLPLFASASGLAVASLYFTQPMLGAIAQAFDLPIALAGTIVSFTQLGYVLGLLFLVPLADVVERKALILGILLFCAIALLAVAQAGNAVVLFAALFVMGILAVLIQILVALAAMLARPADQGRAVGAVTSGVVIGILGARTLAGPIADLSNWRALYFGSAALMLIVTAAFVRVLPARPGAPGVVRYRELVQSVPRLYLRMPILQARAWIAFAIFAAYSILWSSLALALADAPHGLSNGQIGWFGIAGIAGVFGAARAGSLFDRGCARSVSGWSLAAMLLAWWPISMAGLSLWLLFAGIALLDLGGQAVHVTNQSLIFRANPGARGRLVSIYMLFYSAGMGVGALASTMVYAHAGWRGVCSLGAATSAAALLIWVLHERGQSRAVPTCGGI